MVAIEIEVGMISAGQTVTVMAQDGQFQRAIGGKDPHGRTPDHDQQIHRYRAYATQIPPFCAPRTDRTEGAVPVHTAAIAPAMRQLVTRSTWAQAAADAVAGTSVSCAKRKRGLKRGMECLSCFESVRCQM